MYQPQPYGEPGVPRIRGRGTGLHTRLISDTEYQWRERERFDRAEDHIRRSKTRKAMDVLFVGLYASLGVSIGMHLMGTTSLLGALWWIPYLARMPASWLWQPDPDFWVLGSITILKLDLFALILYALLHSFLIRFHRSVTFQRVYIPQ